VGSPVNGLGLVLISWDRVGRVGARVCAGGGKISKEMLWGYAQYQKEVDAHKF